MAGPGEINEKYQKFILLWKFSIKYDGRHCTRLVVGGHMTE